MKTFVGITGTTSVGKSDVAVQLAKALNTQVISADSMQIYRHMDVGTAKITFEQMQGVQHHMLDVAEPDQNFSSHLYRQMASQIIDQMTTLPIVVGGTGLYFDSLVYPPEFGAVDQNERQKLQEILQKDGLTALQQMLKQLDALSYDSVDLNNPQRVMRAIEIAKCGQSRAQGKGKSNPVYDCKLFVLQRDRDNLYAQIDKRVDQMVQNGLVEEVKELAQKYGYCNTSAFSAIGYKEIIAHLQGDCTLDQAIERIKINTRHYAKRQITYYKKMNVTSFIDVEGKSVEQITQEILQNLRKLQLI